MTDPTWIARWEELGAKQVRIMITSGNWPPPMIVHAVEWLAVKDQEERRLTEASQEEQIEIARSASAAASVAASAAERAATAAERQAEAAEKANTRATIALIMAAISIIATAASIAVVHFDTIRSLVR